MKRNKIDICCTAFNEDYGILEWLDYNRSIGINHVWVYDGNKKGDSSLNTLLSSYISDGFVTVIDSMKGILSREVDAYNHFIRTYNKATSHDYDWIGFLDVSSYFTLNKEKYADVSEYFDYIESCIINTDESPSSIFMSRDVFGDDGAVDREEGGITDRFTVPLNKNYLVDRELPVESKCPITFLRYGIIVSIQNDKCDLPNMVRNDGTSVFEKEKEGYDIHSNAWVRYYVTMSFDEYVEYKYNKPCINGEIVGRYDLDYYFWWNIRTIATDKAYSDYMKKNGLTTDLKVYSTYYMDSQYVNSHMAKLPVFVYPVDTRKDYDDCDLNVFWSEFIFMRYLWKHKELITSKWVGFDQYKRHFNYNFVLEQIKKGAKCFVGRKVVTYVYGQYAAYHMIDNLKDCLSVIDELYGPENPYSKNIREKTGALMPGSCFIMRSNDFMDMCKFIFSVLDKLDEYYKFGFDPEKYKDYFSVKYKDVFESPYADKRYTYQRRAFGYLAERLISCWMTVRFGFGNIVVDSSAR